jgi:hypothetical protein
MSEIECQIGQCVVHAGFTAGSRRMATVAVEKPFSGLPLQPACDQCAVEAMMKAGPGLGVRILSLDEWRDQLRPVAGEAMAQLRRAKSSRLEGSVPPEPRALTAAQVPQDEPAAAPLPDAPDAPADTPAAQAAPKPLRESRKAKTIVLLSLASVLLGLILAVTGFEMDGQAAGLGDGGMPGGWPLAIGLTMFLVPLLAGAGWLLVEFAKFSAEEARQCRAWKKTLTPQELMAVNMAEAGLMLAAHEHMKKTNREHREWHTARVVGGAAWDAYRQAQMAAMAAGGGPRSRSIRRDVMSHRPPGR